MCIIVYKPKGAEFPSLETLKICFDNNPDGAGFMYNSDDSKYIGDNVKVCTHGKVIIRKGLMTWKDFEDAFTETFFDPVTGKWNINKQVVFHFRIRTHGKCDAGATQPIAVSLKNSSLRATSIETSVAFAHNGVITECCDNNSKLSDSQIFSKKYLTMLKLFQDITLSKANFIADVIGPSNKMVVMNCRGEIAVIGPFIIDNGIYYSNSTYKYVYTYPTTTKYVRTKTGYEYWDAVYGWQSNTIQANTGKQFVIKSRKDAANKDLDMFSGVKDEYDV